MSRKLCILRNFSWGLADDLIVRVRYIRSRKKVFFAPTKTCNRVRLKTFTVSDFGSKGDRTSQPLSPQNAPK